MLLTLLHFSALTEKIVIILPKMGCPHGIEPHQIQGLDFIHIFPVIQWLVKQSVEVREERREFWRYSALQEFRRNALPPMQTEAEIFQNISTLKVSRNELNHTVSHDFLSALLGTIVIANRMNTTAIVA